jgi:hypothetical protein
MTMSEGIVFAALAIAALALCVVGQVKASREETARLRREGEALREKYAKFEARTEYR